MENGARAEIDANCYIIIKKYHIGSAESLPSDTERATFSLLNYEVFVDILSHRAERKGKRLELWLSLRAPRRLYEPLMKS
jgi:hypothetical protein